MDETVSAEDHIDIRQLISDQVETPKCKSAAPVCFIVALH